MLDDAADELFVNLAADQTQDFTPFVVAAVLVEQVHQLIDRHLLRLLVEPADVLGGRKVFQERAVDEAVEVRATQAEEVVPLAKLADHAAGRFLRFGGVGLPLLVDQEGLDFLL